MIKIFKSIVKIKTMGFLNSFSRSVQSAYPRFVGTLAKGNRAFGKFDSKARAFGNFANILSDGRLKNSEFGKKVMDGYDKAQEINSKLTDVIPQL
jgi:hypothetical protein